LRLSQAKPDNGLGAEEEDEELRCRVEPDVDQVEQTCRPAPARSRNDHCTNRGRDEKLIDIGGW